MLQIKRVYEPAARSDGVRLLVERLWPRGVKKEKLRLDGWLKDVAPSTELRKWFGHDPAKWKEFQRRYWCEIDAHPGALEPILDAQNKGVVTGTVPTLTAGDAAAIATECKSVRAVTPLIPTSAQIIAV